MPQKGTGSPYKNGTRYWGDFRSYADVGGGREPLIARGDKLATKDPAIARELYDERRRALKSMREGGGKAQKSILPLAYLVEEYLPYLEQKKRNKRSLRPGDPLRARDVQSVKKAKHALTTCLTRPAVLSVPSLRSLGTDEVTVMIGELHAMRTPNGGALSPQTVRRHLMELSAMFERARFAKYLDVNPLEKHPDIPPAATGSALDEDGYLTRDEVARLLNEVVPNSKSPWAVEQAYVLFYTGCRLDELNGILVKDIDFTDQVIHIVDYAHRSVKSKFSRRRVPLWPKLATVLRASLARAPRPQNGILFPRAGSTANQTLEKQMMTRIRKSLQSAAVRAGITKRIGHHIARHAYVSARRDMVETTPMGKDVPVANGVIIREVGHATDELIQTTYGHLTRSPVRQHILDYGDGPVDLSARWERSKALMSASVKSGLAEAKVRRLRESLATTSSGKADLKSDEALAAPRAKRRPRLRSHVSAPTPKKRPE